MASGLLPRGGLRFHLHDAHLVFAGVEAGPAVAGLSPVPLAVHGRDLAGSGHGDGVPVDPGRGPGGGCRIGSRGVALAAGENRRVLPDVAGCRGAAADDSLL